MEEKKRKMIPVTPLELIFDLVTVFALSQLTSHLMNHLNVSGLLEMVVMIAAIYTVWAYTSFEATIIDVRKPATQAMIIVVTLLGIFMISGIESAFGHNSWHFVGPFILIQLSHAFFTNFFAEDAMMKRHFNNMAIWIMATVPLWLIGAFFNGHVRLIIWGAAAVIDVMGTWMAHPLPGKVMTTENIDFDAEHILERSRLFLIIALGEAVFTLAETLGEVELTPLIIALAICGFAGIISMWAMYFWGADEVVEHRANRTDNPILMGRLMTNGLIVVVTALIFFGVGVRTVIEEPFEHLTLLPAILLSLGAILYIMTQVWYAFFAFKNSSWQRVIAVVLIAGGAFGVYHLAALWSLVLVAVILTVLAVLVVIRPDK